MTMMNFYSKKVRLIIRFIFSRRLMILINILFNVINFIIFLNVVVNYVNNMKGIVDFLCRYEI